MAMKIIVSSIVDICNSAPNRIHQVLCRLMKRHEVKVVCFQDVWKAQGVNYHQTNRLVELDKLAVHYPLKISVSPVFQELLAPFRIFLQGINGPYDLHFNYNSLLMGAAVQSKLGRSVPMIYDLADDLAGMITTSPQVHPLLQSLGGAVGREILRRNIHKARYVTVTCPEIIATCRIPSEKAVLLPNGVNVELFRFQEDAVKVKKGLGFSGNLVLGYVGVLREWLDWEPVYQAMLRFPQAKLIIVGSEGKVEEQKREVAQKGLGNRVIFTGMVPYDEVPMYISFFDLALIPFDRNSVSINALPLKLFEYMSCRCPVASTELPALQRIAGDAVHYYRDGEGLQKIMVQRLADPVLFQKKADRGQQIVREGYNWDFLVGKLEKLMSGSCENKEGVV